MRTKEVPEAERMTSAQAWTLREHYYTKGIGWANAQAWLMATAKFTTKREASKEIDKMKWLKAHGRPCIPTGYEERTDC